MKLFRQTPESEPHFCDDDCGVLVAAFEGIRTTAGVFCSEECYQDQLTQRLS